MSVKRNKKLKPKGQNDDFFVCMVFFFSHFDTDIRTNTTSWECKILKK